MNVTHIADYKLRARDVRTVLTREFKTGRPFTLEDLRLRTKIRSHKLRPVLKEMVADEEVQLFPPNNHAPAIWQRAGK